MIQINTCISFGEENKQIFSDQISPWDFLHMLLSNGVQVFLKHGQTPQ